MRHMSNSNSSLSLSFSLSLPLSLSLSSHTQAKLLAQDAKILEAEANLKTSAEENEGLKFERNDLIDKLDECETTLRGARNRIEELDDELASTQVRIHSPWSMSCVVLEGSTR
jgi:chromosome segregation ATPase